MTVIEFIECRLFDVWPGEATETLIRKLLLIHNTATVIYNAEYETRGCVGCGGDNWASGYRVDDLAECETLNAIAEMWDYHPEFGSWKK